MNWISAVNQMSGSITSGILPSEQLLRDISYKCSIDRSTSDLKITEDIVNSVIADSKAYESMVLDNTELSKFCYRIKTEDSIRRKLLSRDILKFQTVFNDILGIRVKVDTYPETYPDYYRVVDLRSGKKNDDGYRAVHLYYKLDNYHYIIEVQLWSSKDYKFNSWSHKNGYKIKSREELLAIREEYDKGGLLS